MAINLHQRYTQRQKDANDKEWYKEQIRSLNGKSFGSVGLNGISDYKRMQVNYDIFNNVINLADFNYVCKPYGAGVGNMPANLTNRDIISPKIKVLLGMEMKRPFGWRVLALNEEATTRKEKEKFERIREFVVEQIMAPIKQSIAESKKAQIEGQQLSPEQQNQLQQEIKDDIQAQTPEEVMRYMQREHQDPAEVMAQQIMNYLFQEQSISQKFNKGFKHALISGIEIYYTGIVNRKPVLWNVNSLNFDYDRSTDSEYIEDGEWAVSEYFMTPSQIVSMFGDELTDEDIEDIYQYPFGHIDSMQGEDFEFNFNPHLSTDGTTVRVIHAEWRSLCEVGFLTYIDPETGEEEEMIVSEDYEINKEAGDISIEWRWIPELHEGWLIGTDKFAGMGPVPGQHRDVDNLYYCPLSYKGAAYDNLNSQITSAIDRVIAYQYFYNIIMYRIELLMASDKGKKFMMNINMLPKDSEIDLEKWIYFLEANNIGFMDPTQEGNKGNSGDITNAVKEIDMSLGSDMQKYIMLAEYIEKRCGESLGVSKEMEGQIGPNDAVTNTKQNIIQSSHILEPYFDLHNCVKRNVLQGLIETAKVAYSMYKPERLAYMMDDLSAALLDINQEMLENSTYGIFMSNNTKDAEVKQMVEQLAHAQIQAQTIDSSTVIKVLRAESSQEAQELLEAGEEKKHQMIIQQQTVQSKMEAQQADAQRQHEKEEWKHEEDMVRLKEQERRETVLQAQAMESLGFSTNKDEDGDGTPDILEVYKAGVDVQIKNRQLSIQERALNHKIEHDNQKIEIEKKKAKSQASKKK